MLGFGIGYLLDRIGLLARGTLLQSKSHSVQEVCAGIPGITSCAGISTDLRTITTRLGTL